MNRPLTVPEFAEATGMSYSTVDRWLRRGLLRCAQPAGPGGTRLIPLDEAERIIGEYVGGLGLELACEDDFVDDDEETALQSGRRYVEGT